MGQPFQLLFFLRNFYYLLILVWATKLKVDFGLLAGVTNVGYVQAAGGGERWVMRWILRVGVVGIAVWWCVAWWWVCWWGQGDLYWYKIWVGWPIWLRLAQFTKKLMRQPDF